jgi:hypothetical protein
MPHRGEVVALIPAAAASDERCRTHADTGQPERSADTDKNSSASQHTDIQILEYRGSGTVCHLI